MSETIERLVKLFGKFPGIGPRQARRFVYFLLSEKPEYVEMLIRTISSIPRTVRQCLRCYRYYQDDMSTGETCTVCADEARSDETLMLVEKDVDFEAINKSGSYKGYYFVLGGIVPILDKEPTEKIRLKELHERLLSEKNKGTLREVIIALSATPQGDYTTEVIKHDISPILEGTSITLTILGRGLSTGAELEYSDNETIRHALNNRV